MDNIDSYKIYKFPTKIINLKGDDSDFNHKYSFFLPGKFGHKYVNVVAGGMTIFSQYINAVYNFYVTENDYVVFDLGEKQMIKKYTKKEIDKLSSGASPSIIYKY